MAPSTSPFVIKGNSCSLQQSPNSHHIQRLLSWGGQAPHGGFPELFTQRGRREKGVMLDSWRSLRGIPTLPPHSQIGDQRLEELEHLTQHRVRAGRGASVEAEMSPGPARSVPRALPSGSPCRSQCLCRQNHMIFIFHSHQMGRQWGMGQRQGALRSTTCQLLSH